MTVCLDDEWRTSLSPFQQLATRALTAPAAAVTLAVVPPGLSRLTPGGR